MTKFQTLLLREWMQHQRGWLLMLLLPLALVFLAVLLGPLNVDTIQIEADGSSMVLAPSAALTMLVCTVLITLLVLVIAALAVVVQAPGQARRDQQDRSIEFWLSMPVSNSASIGAMLLMQFLFVPFLALATGWLGSQIVGLVVVARIEGLSAWFVLPWGKLFVFNLAVLARLSLGIVLAMLWVLPLLLAGMVASAWLKRWGVPALIAAVIGGGLALKQLYGVNWIFDTLGRLTTFAGKAFIHIDRHSGGGLNAHNQHELLQTMLQVPSLLLQDGVAALRDCGEPLFWGAQLFSAGCFALLVLRRRNGA